MSSDVFWITLDRSEVAIRKKHRRLPQTVEMINYLQQQASEAEQHSRLQNLKLEPIHISQIAEVPINTVETVMSEMQYLGVVHLWYRLKCPNSQGGNPSIIETNDPEEFQRALTEVCPRCQELHDELNWDDIEQFWKFNTSENSDSRFDPSDFFLSTQ